MKFNLDNAWYTLWRAPNFFPHENKHDFIDIIYASKLLTEEYEKLGTLSVQMGKNVVGL